MVSRPAPHPSLWDSVVLPEQTRQFFNQLITALRGSGVPENRAFLSLNQRILLWGPPGTGKTLISRAIAEKSGVSYIRVGTTDLLPRYIGQAGHAVREVFKRARDKAPSLLAIDAIEQACQSRRSSENSFISEIVVEVLMELDSAAGKVPLVVLIGETDRPEVIDEAVLSRFGTRIELGYADTVGRCAILQNLLADKSVDFDIDQVSRELAENTGQVSGRDLSLLVHYAAQGALERARNDGAVENLKLTRQDLLDQLPQTVRTR